MKKIALFLLILCSIATVKSAFGQGRNSFSGDTDGVHIIKGKLKVSKPGYGLKNYTTGVGTDSTTGIDTTTLKPRFATDTSKLSMRIEWAVKKSDSGTLYYTQYRIDTAKANLRASIATKIGGSGAANAIAVFTNSNTLTASALATDGNNYAMGGSVNPSYRLAVFGAQYVASGVSCGSGVAISNNGNSSINITTSTGTGMDFNIPGGGYYMNFKESGSSLMVLGNSSILLGSGTDRGTGKVQVTGNVSVTGANSSNTYRWDAAAGATPSNTSTPAGWLYVNVAGNSRFIPYYQ